MRKNIVYSLVLVFVLMGVLCLAFRVQRVEASGTIYVRADGSIDPSTANITSADNVTYTFTDNIYDSIVVERNNITIDGAGYKLEGTEAPGSIGISLSLLTQNVTIKNALIKSFDFGIYLWGSLNNTISGNSITHNNYGIYVSLSGYNNISGNNIVGHGHEYGIYLSSSSGNSIGSNKIGPGNLYGIYLSSSNNNAIYGNTMTNNNDGITLYYSSNNKLYHNNFNNNHQVVSTPGYANSWDDGYPSGGNYWIDFTGVDLDHDGIGDTDHVIDANNTDYYPLMGMFHSFNTSLGYYVNVISNSTIEDFTYFESNSTIIIHVSNMTTNQTYGFCRVRIPHALMSEPYNVTIDGAEPHYINYALHDNGENRWIYFSYQHSTLEIVIVPEFPSFLILPLFMIATLLAVIVLRLLNTTSSTKYAEDSV
jgi:parallel beta-helix repeat protein